jgi:cobalamin biosynthesis Mg chelatase CobN
MIVGTRHRLALNWARPVFALMSVVGLLALACFPVLAQAEDSSGVQYSDSIPKAEGENTPVQHKRPPVAKAADNGGASAPTDKTGSPDSNGSTDGSSEEESSGVGGATTDGKGGGSGQGNPAGSATNASGPKAQHSGQNPAATASKSSDSSSSPLVPILIAILVLAAISVAVVMIRQRRQGGPTRPATSQKAS